MCLDILKKSSSSRPGIDTRLQCRTPFSVPRQATHCSKVLPTLSHGVGLQWHRLAGAVHLQHSRLDGRLRGALLQLLVQLLADWGRQGDMMESGLSLLHHFVR